MKSDVGRSSASGRTRRRSADGGLGEHYARLRARLAARPDTEHEQALVRLVVGGLIVLYLLPGALAQGLQPTLFVMLGYLAVSVLVFAHILVAPGESPARRVIGAGADLGTLTWVMAFSASAPRRCSSCTCGLPWRTAFASDNATSWWRSA